MGFPYAHRDLLEALITPHGVITWAEVADLPPQRGAWRLPNGPEAFRRVFSTWNGDGIVAPVAPHRPLPNLDPHEGDGPGTALWTSGSSGSPKLIVHDLSAHLVSARGSAHNIPVGPGDRWLWSLPHHHIGGLAILVRAALSGATVLIGDLADATHASMVPAQLQRIVSDGPPDGLKALLLGGGPIPPKLIDDALAAGWPIHSTWGMTETASQVTTTRPGAPRDELLTAGRVLQGREVRSRNGRLEVRGPVLPRGADEWFTTGDVGSINDGLLTVRGRADAMFISGGENVHPSELERVIGGHPEIEEVVIVGIPDARWGARPAAFLRPRLDLTDWAKEQLPPFGIPTLWLALPEGEGKPDRADLKRQAIAAQSRAEGSGS